MLIYIRLLQKTVTPSLLNSGAQNVVRKIFGKYLLLTNTLSSGLLMAGGDLIQQEIEYQRKLINRRYDWSRTGRMLAIGLLQGPFHHVFYKYLDKFIPGSDLRSVCKKIGVDQLIASPFCIVFFFYGMGILEGKTLKGCNKEFQEKFFTVYTADWCFWPPSQFVNFYFFPPKYRVLYINLVTMLYNVFLSYIKHVDSPTHCNVAAVN